MHGFDCRQGSRRSDLAIMREAPRASGIAVALSHSAINAKSVKGWSCHILSQALIGVSAHVAAVMARVRVVVHYRYACAE